jgi:hypothetical protein
VSKKSKKIKQQQRIKQKKLADLLVSLQQLQETIEGIDVSKYRAKAVWVGDQMDEELKERLLTIPPPNMDTMP